MRYKYHNAVLDFVLSEASEYQQFLEKVQAIVPFAWKLIFEARTAVKIGPPCCDVRSKIGVKALESFQF